MGDLLGAADRLPNEVSTRNLGPTSSSTPSERWANVEDVGETVSETRSETKTSFSMFFIIFLFSFQIDRKPRCMSIEALAMEDGCVYITATLPRTFKNHL